MMMKSYIFLFYMCMAMFFIKSCDRHGLKERRTAVLNALYQQALNDSTTRVARESYPLHKQGMIQGWDTLALSQIEAIYGYTDSLKKTFPFTTEDMTAFNHQLDVNPQAIWPTWGWKTPNFISKEEYPDYFFKGPRLPPPEPPSKPLIEIVSVSVPLVSDDRAFVAVLRNKGWGTVTVNIYLLGKIDGRWTVIISHNTFTT